MHREDAERVSVCCAQLGKPPPTHTHCKVGAVRGEWRNREEAGTGPDGRVGTQAGQGRVVGGCEWLRVGWRGRNGMRTAHG